MGASFQHLPAAGTGYLRPLLTTNSKENTMFDPSLISVAVNAALDVVWPVLHPELIKELTYV